MTMTKRKTKRRLKLESLHEEMFPGMTATEIQESVPDIPVTLYIGKADENIGAHIKDCPICGKTHMHGWQIADDVEYRSIHCDRVDYLTYPDQYRLVLNWDYADNAKLKEQYYEQIKEYERDPEGFTSRATRRQRAYCR